MSSPKRLMKVPQGDAVWSNHSDTILCGSTKFVVVGLKWWDEKDSRDGHGPKLILVFEKVRGIRRSMATILEPISSVEHFGLFGMVDENTAIVGQSPGDGEETCGGIVAADNAGR